MSELSQITGLPIEIKSLNLSLSKGLSLHGNGLNVRSKDNSQQIFSAQDIFLNVKLKPRSHLHRPRRRKNQRKPRCQGKPSTLKHANHEASSNAAQKN